MAWSKRGSEVEQLARKDVIAICTDWRSEAVLSRFDTNARSNQSPEDVDAWLSAFSESLGKFESVRSAEMVRAFSGTGGSTSTVKCEVEFEKAIGWVTIIYVSEGGGWKITSFRIDSPALDHLGRPPGSN
jgi:hypothetical protein